MTRPTLEDAIWLLHGEGYAWLIYGVIFWFGACWGSFIQACYHRIPRGISIVYPGSACPQCAHRLKWWENQPIIGWLVLKGKCSHCQVSIPFRYLWVEVICGSLALGGMYLFFTHHLSGAASIMSVALGVLLLLLAKIDWTYGILPDGLVLPVLLVIIGLRFFDMPIKLSVSQQWYGIIFFIALLFSVYSYASIRGLCWILLGANIEERLVSVLKNKGLLNDEGELRWYFVLIFMLMLMPMLSLWTKISYDQQAILGSALGWSLMLLTRWIGKMINGGQEALGMGDVKLVALLGYLVGLDGVLLMLGLACCLGLMIALLNKGFRLQTSTPFGPSLCASAWLVLLGQYFS